MYIVFILQCQKSKTNDRLSENSWNKRRYNRFTLMMKNQTWYLLQI